jgi:pilus assembly protein CpaC
VHIHYKTIAFAATLAFANQSFGAPQPEGKQPGGPASRLQPCASVTVDPPTYVTLGKSTVVKLAAPATRMVIGGNASSHSMLAENSNKTAPSERTAQTRSASAASDGVADVHITLLSPTELFFLGRKAGSMNVILQGVNRNCHVKDIIVTVDPNTLQAQLTELMPEEKDIKVRAAENSLVLTGKVSDSIKLDRIVSLASSYGDGKKVVNLLSLANPQQVMLEVKIAEVSKTLLEKFGAAVELQRTVNGGRDVYSLLSNFLSNGGGLLEALRLPVGGRRTIVDIDAQKDDGLVRVLAEPNIMAISGQHASFLSGGKVFIPVAKDSAGGIPTITLEEKEFGIGVKFTPTVLDGTRINLKMVSEVSDLSQTGSPFTTIGGATAILPSFTVRRADTTVQLNDGQSFVIAGLIKNNFNETIKRFPGLGEVPIFGALFRSTEFQNDKTELLFVITPRLVKPLAEVPTLPTDNHIVPNRADMYINGKLEGARPANEAVADEAK